MLPNTNQTSLKSADPIKVMIIDDSAIIRGLVSRWIEVEKDLVVVGVGVQGKDGVARAARLDPDIIILDIEMPEMDGITALPLLIKAVPGVRVIMASTLSKAGAEVTIRALSLGATDYIPKPDAGNIAGAEEYKRELFAKLRALGQKRPKSYGNTPSSAAPRTFTPSVINNNAKHNSKFALKPINTKSKIDAVFIGSSTGGPEALQKVVKGLAKKVNVPVFITQHMPVLFTKILAEHLTKNCGAEVFEAEHNMMAKNGSFYLAAGGKHMTLMRTPAGLRIQLNEDPPENFCRPAVDPMFRSAAQIFGDRALAVILTGMGQDGKAGAQILTNAGANLITQDEASSVVWGMPGAATNAGLSCSVQPIDNIATTIIDFIRGAAK